MKSIKQSDIFAERVQRLRQAVEKKNIDTIVLFNLGESFDTNLYYLSGYTGIGVLVLMPKKKLSLIVPSMEEEKALRTGLEVNVWGKTSLYDILKKKTSHARRIGMDYRSLSHSVFERITKTIRKPTVPIESVLETMRAIKSPQEIAVIREVCAITAFIFTQAIERISQGAFLTEAEIAAWMEHEARKNGCSASFPTIIASGKHAALPHHETTNLPLERGFCVIDFGIRYQMYCSDMTRTIFLGTPTPGEKKIYATVLRAQQDSISAIKPGIHCALADKVARKKLGGLAKTFVHSLGHGIGIDVHETPRINSTSKDKFHTNMTIAIEPGVYLRDCYGIRIEDDLLITETGTELLTPTTKELVQCPEIGK